MEDEVLYKPKELFDTRLKKQYHEAALEYFEELTATSKVDPQVNKVHVDEYKKAKAAADEMAQKTASARAGKTAAMVFMIICFVVGAILIAASFANGFNWITLVIGIVLIGGGVGLIFLMRSQAKKAAKLAEELKKLRAEEEIKLRQCYADMAPLNALYDWNIPLKVMEKATPIIDLDPYFRPEKLAYLMEKFDFPEETDPNISTVGVISGQIEGNPFVLERVIEHDFRPKTYEGTLVITWTTYSTDSKGRRVAHHHSETLHAYAEHDAPYYIHDTRLVYGNEAAPRLHFTRQPTNAHRMNEKERKKAVDAGAKKLSKLAEKTITAEHSFSPMTNEEFDVFFNALDRDNEVEFRLLFTPLAQANMLDLLEDPAPYGDDFIMVKDGKLTSVATLHSQTFDYSGNPELFLHYDHAEAKSIFLDYCDGFIQSLFFDLAPILSIPLYQMHKSTEYIYNQQYRANVTSYEQEVMANAMAPEIFYPKGADHSLPLILKATKSSKMGKGDGVNIHSMSYKTTPRTDYVSVLGGDGRYHNVPVHWIQYDRVEANNQIGITYADSATRSSYNSALAAGRFKDLLSGNNASSHFERGLLAVYLGKAFDAQADGQIESIFRN
ncbi:MAG: hypothetical protein K6F32_05105 [Bacilli bacterium]|nr:hypothetical protein [Bacilli bacterium]